MDNQPIPLTPYRVETFGSSPSEIERMETWLNQQAADGYTVVDRVRQRAVGGRRHINVLMHRPHEQSQTLVPQGEE